MRRIALSLFLLLAATACTERLPVGEHDSGAASDASTAIDAAPQDASAIVDASAVDASSADDAAVEPDAGSDGGPIGIDAGWCECPPPLPGCRWAGSPCPCDDYVCDEDAGAPRTCGGFAGLTCAPDEFCDFFEPHSCGAADESGVCQSRPTICPPVIHEACGCDGVTYTSACDAHSAGIDVLYDAPCGAADCAPEDARGEGFCDAIVGYAWDGVSCRWLSGCSCVGADCGRWPSIEACQSAHAHCPSIMPPVPG
ncbi:MAG: hypothetical protein M3Y87_11745 [Myxococcota bacterium]|nr:hypothetical protein [Myxococcota bacterium]